MTTIAQLNYQRKLAGLPLIRFDLRRLQPEDVQDLRDAYAALYEISDTAIGDSRGYVTLARGHGYDQDLCHRNSRLFLPWHRAYVYAFEKALNTALQWRRNDQQLELTLPYWDWTVWDVITDAANGIPKVINDDVYTDATGNVVPNPLKRAKSLYRELSQGLHGDEVFTTRYPVLLRDSIPQLQDEVARYLTNPNFISFSDDFNFGAHGAVHVLVGGQDASSQLPGGGGDMSTVVSAAYDPIFWLHHCMVDKVWYDWQVQHPLANVPQDVLDAPVYGGEPGRTYIDTDQSLRYIYSSDSVQAAIDSRGTIDDTGDDSGHRSLSSAVAAINKKIAVGTVTGPFSRAQLDFAQLHPPKESYEIRAYINNPHCDAQTGFDDSSYAGRMVLFGHGHCHGAQGHCNPYQSPRDEYDIRPKHYLRYKHTTYNLDVTRGLRRYMANRSVVDDITFYLVVLDLAGNSVKPNVVLYRGCCLRTL